jgi:ABC-type multidrug transport system fused ATPase/permease subunit
MIGYNPSRIADSAEHEASIQEALLEMERLKRRHAELQDEYEKLLILLMEKSALAKPDDRAPYIAVWTVGLIFGLMTALVALTIPAHSGITVAIGITVGSIVAFLVMIVEEDPLVGLKCDTRLRFPNELAK